MKKITLLSSVTLLLISTTSISATFQSSATIVSVTPKYDHKSYSSPYQDCKIVEMYTASPSAGITSDQLIAGIFGGVVGNQFGGGDGKKALTLAGTLLGASLAAPKQGSKSQIRNEEVCETKYRTTSAKYLSHYEVTYIFNGKKMTSFTPTKPTGYNMIVDVSVEPSISPY